MTEVAAAEVVGADEAARPMALVREEPHPRERPEDARTSLERDTQALEDSLSTHARPVRPHWECSDYLRWQVLRY